MGDNLSMSSASVAVCCLAFFEKFIPNSTRLAFCYTEAL